MDSIWLKLISKLQLEGSMKSIFSLGTQVEQWLSAQYSHTPLNGMYPEACSQNSF